MFAYLLGIHTHVQSRSKGRNFLVLEIYKPLQADQQKEAGSDLLLKTKQKHNFLLLILSLSVQYLHVYNVSPCTCITVVVIDIHTL